MQEALVDVGSRRVRQIISKQLTDGGSRQSMSNVYISRESMLTPRYRHRKQQRTLEVEEFGRFGRSFQTNRLMVEAGKTQEAAEDVGSKRVRQMISKQSTDGGSRQNAGSREFGSFQTNRLMVVAAIDHFISKQSTDGGSRQISRESISEFVISKQSTDGGSLEYVESMLTPWYRRRKQQRTLAAK
ncbi:hypothetical protein CEXT_50901 [Caerostris extrusa]|uniref:Uncharacterized protein n=1 Tax=Caerostris extrusa TaxID=172846 RepID=A0AAV4MFC9_CAEEX|nr:hypothetical protein CEXT_50901 [Caerostris extrusa]